MTSYFDMQHVSHPLICTNACYADLKDIYITNPSIRSQIYHIPRFNRTASRRLFERSSLQIQAYLSGNPSELHDDSPTVNPNYNIFPGILISARQPIDQGSSPAVSFLAYGEHSQGAVASFGVTYSHACISDHSTSTPASPTAERTGRGMAGQMPMNGSYI